VIRCDNGPEFTSQALAGWAEDHAGIVFIPSGTPWNNGYVESFNSRLRDECLNVNSFWNLRHARTVIAIWRDEYNTTRPHSALGYLAPAAYAARPTHGVTLPHVAGTTVLNSDSHAGLRSTTWFDRFLSSQT